MLDLIMVIAVAVSFALATAYAHLCCRVLAPPPNSDIVT
jgi:hypothetical protein